MRWIRIWELEVLRICSRVSVVARQRNGCGNMTAARCLSRSLTVGCWHARFAFLSSPRLSTACPAEWTGLNACRPDEAQATSTTRRSTSSDCGSSPTNLIFRPHPHPQCCHFDRERAYSWADLDESLHVRIRACLSRRLLCRDADGSGDRGPTGR